MRVIYKMILTWCLIFSTGMYLSGCEDEVECSGFDSNFSVTGFTLTESEFDGNFFNLNEISLQDTISYDNVSLVLTTNYQTVARVQSIGGIFGTAYACTPPVLTSLDTIQQISVVQNVSEFSSNSFIDYTSDFNIATFDEFTGESPTVSLDDFNNTANTVPLIMSLQYAERPNEIIPASFLVRIELTNGEIFELASKMFYISR